MKTRNHRRLAPWLAATTTGPNTSRARPRVPMASALVVIAGLLVATFAWAAPASASHQFTVNTTADNDDADLGDGSCADAEDFCSLRAAVQQTNQLPGTDTIFLPTGTYVFDDRFQQDIGEDAALSGDLDLTESVSIEGSGGPIVAAGSTAFSGIDRVFHVMPGVTASFSNLTIQNGLAEDQAGGGIFNLGTTSIVDSTFTGNAACHGGAVVNGRNNSDATVSGALSITGSTFAGNKATCDGAAGNAIENVSGEMTIDRTTVESNSAEAVVDGAISNLSTLTITDSAITNNGGSFGGGLTNACCGDAVSTLTATNLTLAGNTATSGGGGFSQSTGGSATFINSTITGNSGPAGGIGGGRPGYGVVSLKNTIVANQASGSDCGFTVNSLGHNLESGDTCGFDDDPANNPDLGDGDWTNTDPALEALADNGGPTRTQAPALTSAATDNGSNVGCPATDQRGVARPYDGDGDGDAACDIGALELVPEPPLDTTPPVISPHDDVTAEATGSDGATVDYTDPTATDDTDGDVPADCEPAAGSTFALGDTTVACSAEDNSGNAASSSFVVRVLDTTPPTLHLPSDLAVGATGPGGAAVTYDATATDLVDGTDPVTCAPASGSTFPVGETVVNCSSEDARHNSSQGSFTVHVRGAEDLLTELKTDVDGSAVDKGMRSHLSKDLKEAIKHLEMEGGNKTCKDLDQFIKRIADDAGKKDPKTPADLADQWISRAQEIQAILGC